MHALAFHGSETPPGLPALFAGGTFTLANGEQVITSSSLNRLSSLLNLLLDLLKTGYHRIPLFELNARGLDITARISGDWVTIAVFFLGVLVYLVIHDSG